MQKSAALLLLLAASALPCEEEPLFNGRDVAGWNMAGTDRFVVENGTLKTEGGSGLLYYGGRQFANGIIRVVFKTADTSSHAAVIIRMANPSPLIPESGSEMPMRSNSEQVTNGIVPEQYPS